MLLPGIFNVVFNVIFIHLHYDFVDCRFPVQRVIRPQSDEFHDFRGYAGKIEGGIFKPGDEVLALPSGFTSKVKTIETMNGYIDEAFPPQNVVLTLEDDIDISRGDMIVKPNNQPEVGQDIEMFRLVTRPGFEINPKGECVPGGNKAVDHGPGQNIGFSGAAW